LFLQKAIKVCKSFRKTYGKPRLGNKFNPLDEYLFILLSLRTTYWSFEKVYRHFKNRYPKWEDVYKARAVDIARVIKDAGLSNQKAAHIKSALRKIRKDFGALSLKDLNRLNDSDVQNYLLTLPGLGLKAARCIMMYSLGCNVLPVDTHTQRVSERLGLIKNVDNKKAHQLLDRIIPQEQCYVYHVGCVMHGRRICLYNRPKCVECFVKGYCDYYKEINDA
jgi:endonuclease III